MTDGPGRSGFPFFLFCRRQVAGSDHPPPLPLLPFSFFFGVELFLELLTGLKPPSSGVEGGVNCIKVFRLYCYCSIFIFFTCEALPTNTPEKDSAGKRRQRKTALVSRWPSLFLLLSFCSRLRKSVPAWFGLATSDSPAPRLDLRPLSGTDAISFLREGKRLVFVLSVVPVGGSYSASA